MNDKHSIEVVFLFFYLKSSTSLIKVNSIVKFFYVGTRVINKKY